MSAPAEGRLEVINETDAISLQLLENGIHMRTTLSASIIAGYWRILKDPDDYSQNQLTPVYSNGMKSYLEQYSLQDSHINPGIQKQLELCCTWLKNK